MRRNRATGEITQSRFIRFGFVGLSDVVGQLRRQHGGRFLAIEVKMPGKHATPEQQQFLDAVNGAGGIGFVAHSVEDVMRELGACQQQSA